MSEGIGWALAFGEMPEVAAATAAWHAGVSTTPTTAPVDRPVCGITKDYEFRATEASTVMGASNHC